MASPPRPSPTQSATAFALGTKRKGNDGRMYVVAATKTGVRRWVPSDAKAKAKADNRRVATTHNNRRGVAKTPNNRRVAKRVYVLDNGGVPFVVELSSTTGPGVARVLRQRKGTAYEVMEAIDKHDPARQDEWLEHWRDVKYTRAWVGLDPAERGKKSLMTRLMNRISGPSWWHGGNSLLLALDGGGSRHLVIGWKIYEFVLEPGDRVVDYVSTMGNSGVPYPYVVGANNTYLTTENVWMPNELVTQGEDQEDPYDVFYQTDLSTGKHVKNLTTTQRKNKLMFRESHKLRRFKMWHDRHE